MFIGIAQATDKTPAKDDVTAMLDAMKLLKERDAQLVMTINKDMTMDLINLNTGERIEGCKLDRWGNLAANEKGPRCYLAKDDRHDNFSSSEHCDTGRL